jgi:uncharacterized protein YbbK (DUF523 family)
MEKILVSACLLGTPCRYDGKSKPCNLVIELKGKYQLVPICPEELGGLSTPRLPSEIQGNRVVRCDGYDVTEEYKRGAEISLSIAKSQGIKKAILKSKSPSCSNSQIYDGTYKKVLINGYGITAKLLIDNGIMVISEEELDRL